MMSFHKFLRIIISFSIYRCMVLFVHSKTYFTFYGINKQHSNQFIPKTINFNNEFFCPVQLSDLSTERVFIVQNEEFHDEFFDYLFHFVCWWFIPRVLPKPNCQKIFVGMAYTAHYWYPVIRISCWKICQFH